MLTYGNVGSDRLRVLHMSSVSSINVLTDDASMKAELLDRVVVVFVHALVVQEAQVENILCVLFLGQLVQGGGQAWNVVLALLDGDTLDAAHDDWRLLLFELQGDLLQVSVHEVKTLLVVVVGDNDEKRARSLRTKEQVSRCSWAEGTCSNCQIGYQHCQSIPHTFILEDSLLARHVESRCGQELGWHGHHFSLDRDAEAVQQILRLLRAHQLLRQILDASHALGWLDTADLGQVCLCLRLPTIY